MHKLLLALLLTTANVQTVEPIKQNFTVWGEFHFSKRENGPLLIFIRDALEEDPNHSPYDDGSDSYNRPVLHPDIVLYLGVDVKDPAAAQRAFTAYAQSDRIECSYDELELIIGAHKAKQCVANGINLELYLLIEGLATN